LSSFLIAGATCLFSLYSILQFESLTAASTFFSLSCYFIPPRYLSAIWGLAYEARPRARPKRISRDPCNPFRINTYMVVDSKQLRATQNQHLQKRSMMVGLTTTPPIQRIKLSSFVECGCRHSQFQRETARSRRKAVIVWRWLCQ